MQHLDRASSRIREALAWLIDDSWRIGVAAVALAAALSVAYIGLRPKPLPHIGVILPHSVTTDPDYLTAFETGLRDLGYVQGKTVVITTRHATLNTAAEFAELASDLVQRNVDIFMVASTPALRAACSETAKGQRPVPIVIATIASTPDCDDPPELRKRYVKRRVTGSTLQAVPLVPKLLELLQATGPYERIALLTKPGTDIGARFLERLRTAAPGVMFKSYPVINKEDIDTRFDEIAKLPEAERPQAMIVAADGFFREQAAAIAAHARKSALPSIFSTRNQAKAGGLLAYGQSYPEAYRRAAFYVDQVLRGVKPHELPVEGPAKIILAVNRATFDDISTRRGDVRLPVELLVRADEVFTK